METLFDDQIVEEIAKDLAQYNRWKAEHHVRPSDPITSVEAAEKMAPKAGRATLQALFVLKLFANSTASELEDAARKMDPRDKVSDGAVRKRLSDLRAKGLAKVTGKRKCRITGMNAQTWEAT